MTTLRALVEQSHGLAKEKGWYGPDGKEERNVGEALALIHSEISEALEEYRTGCAPQSVFYPGGPKPEGFGVELADAVIRIADLCGYLGIDLQAMVETKHAYNQTRPHRHGNKRC